MNSTIVNISEEVDKISQRKEREKFLFNELILPKILKCMSDNNYDFRQAKKRVLAEMRIQNDISNLQQKGCIG